MCYERVSRGGSRWARVVDTGFPARFQVMPFRDPVLFEQFNCKPLNAAAPESKEASVPITPGETEESAPKTGRRLSRFNEL